ncbi:hypothetical protein K432DRAFT_264778, partial [Lepidopterella palustris CBS 459.81]
CPYHDPILQMVQTAGPRGLDPMDRFLSEGVSEQSALFRRPDTGQLSTNKGCLCAR